MKRLLWLFAVLFCATFVMAQEAPKVSVFGGWAYHRTESDGTAQGWQFGLDIVPTKYFGIQAQYSGTYEGDNGLDATTAFLTAGPEFVFSNEHFSTYIRGHLGWVHGSGDLYGWYLGDDSFVWGFGAAADYHFSKYFSWRLVNIDYLRVDDWDTNILRIGTGIVIHTARK